MIIEINFNPIVPLIKHELHLMENTRVLETLTICKWSLRIPLSLTTNFKKKKIQESKKKLEKVLYKHCNSCKECNTKQRFSSRFRRRCQSFWRISANGASSIQQKPFINAIRMEAVFAFRNGLQCLLRLVLTQAYWASVVIRLGQPSALTKDYSGIGLYCWSIESSNNNLSFWINRGIHFW
jgi:hypothetical protein